MVEYGKSFSGGDVFLPPSKSAAHRALLCAALSGRAGRIFPIDTSKDMEAMLGAVCALGAKAVYREDQNAVLFGEAAPHPGKGEDVHCLESGNTLRFVTPVAAALGGEWLFYRQRQASGTAHVRLSRAFPQARNSIFSL